MTKISARINSSPYLFLAMAMFLVLTITLATRVNAGEEATVTATVTAANISVGVSSSTVTYGTLSIGTTKETTNTGVDQSQLSTNDGNVTEDFNIKGINSTSAGVGWTLVSSTGSLNEYVHKWCVAADCDGAPTWDALSTGYTTLDTAIAVGGTKWFDLQLGAPSSTDDYTEQTVNVTVQAIAN